MELLKQRLVVTVTIEELTAKITTGEVIVIGLTKARNSNGNMYPDGLQIPPTEKLGIPNKSVKLNGLISLRPTKRARRPK